MGRRALVLGSGGREHALAWALLRSPSVDEVLVAPGNAGCATSVPIADLGPEAVVALARQQGVDLVVVGPEAPLCAGVVDALGEAGILAFGPTRAAARLEGSKVFMKELAARHDIPTAPFLVTSDIAEAERYIDSRGPVVVKADGLCGGKGAIVAASAAEAKAAARSMLVEGAFGPAGETIVIEDRLEGYELSVHVVSDGRRFFALPVARDHKRVGDGDTGPNTGGMGAFAPVAVEPALMERIEARVLRPTLDGMRAEGAEYRGVLYAGLMVTPDGTPYLLEHNVRFGDPETQVLMRLCEGDLGELFASAAEGQLDPSSVHLPDRHAVVIVLASAGYPGKPSTGIPIEGLDARDDEGVMVFHAGTRREGDAIVTAGGRVLGVTAAGRSAREARERAYRRAESIRFDGMLVRRDIAWSALGSSSAAEEATP